MTHEEYIDLIFSKQIEAFDKMNSRKDRMDRFFCTILNGLMMRYSEPSYSDSDAIAEAWKLAKIAEECRAVMPPESSDNEQPRPTIRRAR